MTTARITDPTTICADPHWLPHAFDPQSRRIQFVKVDAAAFAAPAFLADWKPQTASDQVWIAASDVLAMQPETGPLHFIFHTAFCRSTLLVRALNIPEVSIGLSEPGIIASLASAGAAQPGLAQQLIAPCLNLLARPHDGTRAVFVKPTNHANMLIPAMLQARPDARAILMSNALPAFLRSVNRKGMMGRRWGRQLYWEVQGYAPLDMGMDARETFAMTDMQAAGAAWLLNRRLFADVTVRFGGTGETARVMPLDGDAFNTARTKTIAAIADFTGTPLTPQQAEQAATSPIFTTHAKQGGDFAAQEAGANQASTSAAVEEEIAKVAEWVELIAGQLGLDIA